MHSLPEKQINGSMQKLKSYVNACWASQNNMMNINQEQFITSPSLLQSVAKSTPFCQRTALLLYLSSWSMYRSIHDHSSYLCCPDALSLVGLSGNGCGSPNHMYF